MTMSGPPMSTPPRPAASPAASKLPSRSKTRTYTALALGMGFIAMLAFMTMSSPDRGKIFVYVAERALPARARLAKSDVKIVTVSKESVVGGAYQAGSEAALTKSFPVKEMYSRFPISKGAQLTRSMAGGPSGLTRDLGAGDRLISVSATTGTAVGGSLRVGDTVDIIAVGGSPQLASLVVSGAEIKAVSTSAREIDAAAQRQASAAESGGAKNPSKYLPGDPIPGLYTFKVSSDVATKLALLDQSAKLYLVYRAPNATSAAVNQYDLTGVLCAPTVGPDGIPAVAAAPGVTNRSCVTIPGL